MELLADPVRHVCGSVPPMRNQPKVAYLVSRYPSVSHTFIFCEIQALKRLGFDICVASINSPDRSLDQMPADEAADAAETFYVKRAGAIAALGAILLSPLSFLRGFCFALSLAGPNLVRVVYHLFYLAEAILVGRWLRRRGMSHLHVHFATEAATVAAIASHAFDVPFSISVHGPDEFDNVERFSLGRKVAAAKFLCCIGDFCRSQLMKQSPPSEWHKFHKIPLGVDPNTFSPSDGSRYVARPKLVCVGRLVPAKGQHCLLEAAGELAASGVEFQLVLVGDGPDRSSLESTVDRLQLRNYVTFTGAINRDCIREQLEHCDCFVLASFAEGIPVALMEAMAMEIACCSTFVAGIPELIRSGTDGLLVPPADTTALVSALQTLIEDPSLRRRLGTSARQRVIKHYNLDTNVERLAELFRKKLLRAEAHAPDASVIIVSYNTCSVLRECLQRLTASEQAIDIEVFVVDNASVDGSAMMVRREFPQVKLIEADRNLGFAGANNAGLVRSTGRHLILLNSDAFVSPDAVAAAVRQMDRHPEVGAAGARLRGVDGADQPSARRFPSLISDFLSLTGIDWHLRRILRLPQIPDPACEREADWITGAFLIVSRAALVDAGLLDTRYFLYYEEVDWCRRIRQAGWKVRYWPEIEVIHLGGESSKTISHLHLSKVGMQLALWRMRSSFLYYRKHHGVHAAFAYWIEAGWLLMRYSRNAISSAAANRMKAAESLRLLSALKQAWRDTQGGRVSPEQPW